MRGAGSDEGRQSQKAGRARPVRRRRDEDPGAPGHGEIRVRIHASSLNFHDYGIVCGRMPSEDGRIPMSDGAGTVEAIGEGVSEFKAGDDVVSLFFPTGRTARPRWPTSRARPATASTAMPARVVVRPASWFTQAPEGYSHAEAATLTTAGLTAWRALVVDGGMKAGDTVLMLGTGGVSIFALQLARRWAPASSPPPPRMISSARLREMGVDQTINYKRDETWGETVLELTGGRGVDHVIEVGGPGTLAQSITACRIGGHIALIGVLTGRAGEMPTAELMAKHQRLQGLIVGSRRHQTDMVRAIEATGIKPVIDRRFALEAIADAFRHEESGSHFGKICLEF